MSDLIEQMTKSFCKSTGIEWEEIKGEATVGYYEALTTHIPEKGSLRTWAYASIKTSLIDFYMKQRHAKYEIEEGEAPDPGLRILFLDRLKSMTKEAQEVCQMIFTSPVEYLELTPRLSRGKIIKQLREKGWPHSKVWNAIHEIKQMLFEEAR